MRGVALVLLLTGCQFSEGLVQGYRCPTGECPAGQVCAAGYCVSPEAPDAAAPTIDGMPPANLVADPGMEQGTGAWMPFYGSLRNTTTQPHGGTTALVMCKATDGGLADFTVYQVVLMGAGAVPMGTHYHASIWVRASTVMGETPPPTTSLTIRENGGSTPLADYNGTAVTDLTSTWTRLDADGVIQAPDRDDLELIVWGRQAPDGSCFAIDDADVYVVP